MLSEEPAVLISMLMELEKKLFMVILPELRKKERHS